MAKATLFVLIAVAAGLIVYLIAAPMFVKDDPGSHGPQTQGAGPSQPATLRASDEQPTSTPPPPSTHNNSSPYSVDSSPAIDVPLSNEQRSQKDLEARRGPLYDWIRARLRDILVGWQPSTADPATLDLYMARADSYAPDILLCMKNLVEPYATKYGFNHVHFYTPNPPTDVNQWHVDSEATPDSDGSWHLYKK